MAQINEIDDFKGSDTIILNPGDTGVGTQFEFTVKTANSAKAGFLGAGRSVSSVIATIYNDDTDTDVTATMLDSAATDANNIVTVPLNHSGITGTYRLKLIVTLDDSGTRDTRFRRIVCK